MQTLLNRHRKEEGLIGLFVIFVLLVAAILIIVWQLAKHADDPVQPYDPDNVVDYSEQNPPATNWWEITPSIVYGVETMTVEMDRRVEGVPIYATYTNMDGGTFRLWRQGTTNTAPSLLEVEAIAKTNGPGAMNFQTLRYQ